MGAIVALGPLAAAPPAAHALGFGPVRSLSPATGNVDQLEVAVAPTGETALLWQRLGPRGGTDFEFVAAIGPDPEQLGPPRPIQAATGPAFKAAAARLLARPDGGFVACFDGYDGSTMTFGCAFTNGTGDFGPMRIIERRSKRSFPFHKVAMRTDGKLAVMLAHRVPKGRLLLRTTTLDAEGVTGPLRPLATVGRQAQFDLVTLDDGTTAVSLATPRQRDPKGAWDLALRVTAPGQDTFGPPRNLRHERTVQSGRGTALEGGRELRIHAIDFDDEQIDILRSRADGSFASPLRFPRVGRGLRWGPVVTLADGAPIAITQAERPNDECSYGGLGVIGSGPLIAAGGSRASRSTERLSKPEQIAFNPLAATLADGTVIASWQNAASAAGSARVEAAIRPTGSSRFRRSQVLPRLAQWWEHQLAAGGEQAVLAWIVGNPFDGSSRVVMSSLRRSPPYAAPARLSKRPTAPCGRRAR